MNDQPPYARRVIVFQHYALFPHLTVQDNVAFGLRVKGRHLPEAEVTRRVKAVLDLVQLADLETPSTPAQRRAATTRGSGACPGAAAPCAPAGRAPGALDRQLRKAMQTELRRIQREVGMTFLYVTHDQDEALQHVRPHGRDAPGRYRATGYAAGHFSDSAHSIRGGVYGGGEYFHGSGADQKGAHRASRNAFWSAAGVSVRRGGVGGRVAQRGGAS